jgi:hypothetical protein
MPDETAKSRTTTTRNKPPTSAAPKRPNVTRGRSRNGARNKITMVRR